MMRYTTNALVHEVERIAPEAIGVERDRGMTTFSVRERDAECVLSELRRADYRVEHGWPRVSYSSPRAFASAASHIRRH
jgi:hypothetical protein